MAKIRTQMLPEGYDDFLRDSAEEIMRAVAVIHNRLRAVHERIDKEARDTDTPRDSTAFAGYMAGAMLFSRARLQDPEGHSLRYAVAPGPDPVSSASKLTAFLFASMAWGQRELKMGDHTRAKLERLAAVLVKHDREHTAKVELETLDREDERKRHEANAAAHHARLNRIPVKGEAKTGDPGGPALVEADTPAPRTGDKPRETTDLDPTPIDDIDVPRVS